MQNEKRPRKAPAGTVDVATDMLEDPDFAEIMGPPVEPDDGGDESDEG